MRALPLLLVMSGCASTTFLGSARTLPPGSVEILVAPAVATDLASQPFTAVAHARVGVSKRADLGLRAFTFGGYGEARFQLHRSEDGVGDGDFLLALRVGARRSYDLGTDGGYLAVPSAQLYLVGGFELTKRATLLLGQRLEIEALPSRAGVWAGFNLGLRLRLLPWLALLPEYSASVLIAPPSAAIRHEVALAVVFTIPGE
jgi:hypothetical protein